MKRIPLIQTAEGELCQDFKSKCHTFIKAVTPKGDHRLSQRYSELYLNTPSKPLR